MRAFHTRRIHHDTARTHRLDPRQESRRSLVLIMLMGLATLSVMITTQTVTHREPAPVHFYSSQ